MDSLADRLTQDLSALSRAEPAPPSALVIFGAAEISPNGC